MAWIDLETGQDCFVCFDLELTGLNRWRDRIIEAAFILCDSHGTPIERFETLVNPERDTGPVDIHHITNEMVGAAPLFANIADRVRRFIDGKVLVGLNNALDFECLKREFARVGFNFRPGASLDISPILRDDVFTSLFERELIAIAQKDRAAHRAMPDTEEVLDLLNLVLRYQKLYPDRVREISPCSIKAINKPPASMAVQNSKFSSRSVS